MEKDIQYTKLLKQQIETYGKEKRFLEFKSNYQTAEKLGQYISALSNGACLEHQDMGYLYFGVDDDTLKVKGTTFDSSKVMARGNQLLEIYLRQMISPRIDFKIEEFMYEDEKRIVVFIIPAAVQEPTCFQHIPYIRVDSSTTDMRPFKDWMRQLYNSQKDWSREIVEEATMEDLDTEAIAAARKGFKERFPDKATDVDEWTDETFLDRAKLTLNGQITRTALLLLGNEEAQPILNHIAQIVWKLNDGTQMAGDIFSLPFILSVNKILVRIRNYRFKIYPDNSLIPAEVWKYDTKTILEALYNCIAHQDYTRNARIILTEEKDNLLFQNAGDFYEGTFEDYILGEKTPEKYRNNFLVRAMVNLKMIDTQGYGIHTMFLRQRNRYLPMPDYELSTAENVVLRIPGRVIDENYSKILVENSEIDLTTAVLMDKVQKGQGINDDAAKSLKKQHLIEGRKPNFFISKKVAKITHQESQYTLNKGYTDEECMEWVVKGLKDHGVLSRKQINEILWTKLPAVLSDEQKLNKIENILRKLRKAEVIYVGEKKLWRLNESNQDLRELT